MTAIKEEYDPYAESFSMMEDETVMKNKIYVRDGIEDFISIECLTSSSTEDFGLEKVQIPLNLQMKKEKETDAPAFNISSSLKLIYGNALQNSETLHIKDDLMLPTIPYVKNDKTLDIFDEPIPGSSHTEDECKLFEKKDPIIAEILARENSNGMAFNCDFCNKNFNHKSTFEKHLLVHTGEKPYICEYCEKGFNRKYNLKTHLRIHSGEKPHTCEYCNKSFSDKSNLKQHIKHIHSGIRPYTCEYCSKSFSQHFNLKVHLLLHSGKKAFTCKHCSKKFTQKSHLTTHLLVHSGEKPYSCNHCNKSFSQSSHLNDHLLSHSGMRIFACEYCKKSFTHKSTLKRHVLIHSGLKQFTCEICNKFFSRNTTLKKHLLIHSEGKMNKSSDEA